MAKRYENECVGCPDGKCLGDACSKRNVLRYYCDKCDEEAELFKYGGKELCIDCIEAMLDKVE